MNTQANQDRIDELFTQAIKLQPGERQAFLNSAGKGDAEVLADVQMLLAAHDRAEQSTDFLASTPNDQRLFVTAAQRRHALIGQNIGPFEVSSWLGGGGFGDVYLAQRNDSYRQTVALKVLRAGIEGDDRVRARFELERQLQADFQHEHIARLLYGGSLENGQPYIVMEYIEGRPITEYCDAKQLPVAERLALFRQVCEAVAYAHRFGAIHRDIKPGNILINAEGNAKLLDFGIAKIVDSSSRLHRFTMTAGPAPLTPPFASPEQVRGESVSTASDVYSLGVVLYELLTGRRPYELFDLPWHEVVRVISEARPRRPSSAVLMPVQVRCEDGTVEIRSAETFAEQRSTNAQKLNRLLQGDLEQIVLMALRKERDQRYQTVEALIQDLDRFNCGQTIVARPVGQLERARRWCKRSPHVAALSGLLLIALVMGTGASTWLAIRADHTSKQYRLERDRAENNLDLAEEAVDGYLTRVADDERLKQSDLHPLRNALLESAIPFYEKFSQQTPGDAERESNRYAAYRRLAEIRRELGRFDDALEDYRQAIAIQEKLVENFPNNADFRYDLAQAYDNSGYLSQRQGDPYGAWPNMNAAVDIYEKLNEDFPKNASFEDGLAKAYNNFGSLLAYGIDRNRAPEQFEKALKIEEKLASDYPKNANYRQELARTHNKLGLLNRASEHFERAIAIQLKLVGEYPKTAEYREELARSYTNLGILLRNQNEPEAARQPLEHAVEYLQQISQSFPSVPEYRSELAKSYGALGALFASLRTPNKAKARFESALAIQTKLVADFPQVPEHVQELARTLRGLGDLARQAEQGDDARAHYENELRIRLKLAADFPDVTANRQDLMESFQRLATLLRDQNNLSAARSYYEKAQALRSQLIADYPTDRRLGRHGWAEDHEGLVRLLENIPESTLSSILNPAKPVVLAKTTSEWQIRYLKWRKNGSIKLPGNWEEAVATPPLETVKAEAINFSWGDKSPSPQVPTDYFGLVATTNLTLPAGKYRLLVTSDDGVRVSVDDEQLIRDWGWHQITTDFGQVELDEGKHTVKIEYFEIDGSAALAFSMFYVGVKSPRPARGPD